MTTSGSETPVTVQGVIERFTFRNPDTDWAVVKLVDEANGQPLTVVGSMAQLREGQRLKINGMRSVHPRFGVQVKADAFEAIAPNTEDGIEAYLASGLVRGIGPGTARKIVAAFGVDTLRVIEEEPTRLRQVRGLGERRVEELGQAVRAQKDLQNVLVFLRSHGLGPALAARIVRRYGARASALIQANPFRLADDRIGIGFRTADRLAGQMGIAPTAPERLDAALEFVLGQAAKEGHCYLPEAELVQRTAELLSLAEAELSVRVPELARAGRVARQMPPGPVLLHDDPRPIVYPIALAIAEDGVARSLDRLLQSKRRLPVRADAAIEWFEQTSATTLPDGQREALRKCLGEPVTVVTGGPGVGKTTIVRALVKILEQKQLRPLLAAPTGRAAKRMEEATGRPASTIHRLLEFTPGAGRFARNAETPLEGDVLVVDEASMLDIQIAHALLQAVPDTMSLVLVGDRNQLPSVGAGNVLDDVVQSGRVPTVALTRVFRQQSGSQIVRVAHDMLAGVAPTKGGDGSEGSDFYFVEARNGAHARLLIRELVTQRIPKRFGLDPQRDIQILCPMYRGEVGADALNRDLQDLLHPGQIEVERSGKRFRVGDKVMQVRNDYDRDVWNGDVGRITHIDTGAAKVFLRFLEAEQEYRFEELDDLVPAYAISVHRSQGSEYPAVVVPVTTDHFLMLRRSVVYTAITRGKRLVVVVGSTKAMEMAVANADDGQRYSGLRDRLRSLLRGDGVAPGSLQQPEQGA
ncbi:MAG: ATP-dependent RecD-like DNA helicase [Planctomycetota bacterium]|jgi:exodeoxyribonuclease V alpha subunit